MSAGHSGEKKLLSKASSTLEEILEEFCQFFEVGTQETLDNGWLVDLLIYYYSRAYYSHLQQKLLVKASRLALMDDHPLSSISQFNCFA